MPFLGSTRAFVEAATNGCVPALAHTDTLVVEFEDVYRDEFDYVWRCLRRFGVPEANLEDMTQEVFIVVARRLDEFEQRSSLRTWLFKIVSNVAMSHGRAQGRHARKMASFESCLWKDSSEPTHQQDARRLLAHLLSSLDDDKRDIYIQVELEGIAVSEVAAVTGVNANTLHARLRSARRQVADAVARLMADGGET